jgi:CheY-like chemotaxis protein
MRTLVAQGKELLGTDRAAKHAVTVKVPNDSQFIWADPTEFLQVVINLALNACEAGPPNTNHVSLEVLPSYATHPARPADIGMVDKNTFYSCFVVSDTGAGIDPAAKVRMFERYFTSKGSAGTGLGLPIVAGILESNNAAIWFDSEPNQGTVATVAWPSVEDARSKISIKTTETFQSVELSGRNILVVDDVADVADVLAQMLEKAGAVAVAVSDPSEAHSLLSENPGVWSALVTDFHMPKVNGADLAKVARSLEPVVSTVLVTALPEKANELAELFDFVLSKPVDAERLIESVRAAIATHFEKS